MNDLIISVVWGNDSGWFWTMCQFFVLIITLPLIYRQVKAQQYGNMLQSLHKLDGEWNSERMIKFRNHVGNDFRENCLDIHQGEEHVINFFEDLGVYVKKGIFAKDIVWEFYSYKIEFYWPIFERTLQDYRNKTKDKTFGSNFQNLHSKMTKISKSKGLDITGKTNDELLTFAKMEENKMYQ